MGVLDAPPGLRSRGAWAATTAYAKNDIVTYLGGVYRALASFTSAGSFNPANWEQWVPQSGTTAPAAAFDKHALGPLLIVHYGHSYGGYIASDQSAPQMVWNRRLADLLSPPIVIPDLVLTSGLTAVTTASGELVSGVHTQRPIVGANIPNGSTLASVSSLTAGALSANAGASGTVTAVLKSLSNRYVGGTLMEQVAMQHIANGAGSTAWTLNTKALVTILGMLNNARLFGTDANGIASFKDALRFALHYLRATSRNQDNTASFTYYSADGLTSGGGNGFTANALAGTGWTQVVDVGFYMGNGATTTSTAGEYVKVDFTGDEVVLVVHRAKQGVAGGTWQVLDAAGGNVLQEVSCAGGLPANAVVAHAPVPIRLTGYGAGSHSVWLRKKAGDANPVWIDGYLLPRTSFPLVVVGKEGNLADYTVGSPYNQGSNAAMDLYRAAIDTVVAEAPFNDGNVVIADITTSRFPWDPATMVASNDKIHANDLGMTSILYAFLQAIARALYLSLNRPGVFTL